MPAPRPLLAAACLASLVLPPAPPIHAATTDASSAGTPVLASHTTGEVVPFVLADGAGGAYVSFKRDVASPTPQRLVAHMSGDAVRDAGWNATNVVSNDVADPIRAMKLVTAPAGSVWCVADLGAGNASSDLLHRLGAAGPLPSDALFAPASFFTVFDVLPRSGGGARVYARRFDGTGQALHMGLAAATGGGPESSIPVGVVTTGNLTIGGGDRVLAIGTSDGGAIVTLQLPNVGGGSTAADLIAIRVDANGAPLWTPAARVVSNAVRDQFEVVGVSDGADGVILAWRDKRNTATGDDLYAVRLTSAGAVAAGWTANGKAVAQVTGAQTSAVAASDNAGGMWLAWVDGRTGANDIEYTHLLGNGAPAAGFATNGNLLCGEGGGQSSVQMVGDGQGGAFAVWIDDRAVGRDLYGTHFDAQGVVSGLWTPGGDALCTANGAQQDPALALVATGRAMVAWVDARTGLERVYALPMISGGPLAVSPHASARVALSALRDPARGRIELEVTTNAAGARVELLDVSGRRMAMQTIEAASAHTRVTIEAHTFAPGVYLARVIAANGEYASRRIALLR